MPGARDEEAALLRVQQQILQRGVAARVELAKQLAEPPDHL